MSTILKCKMCGGDIDVNGDITIGTCLYCGSTMTLPRIDNEKKARLFNRANQYRLNNEFDKAYEAYKLIVEEDDQEAEAYWGMLLAEYGVEYVEDPTSKKRIPTCHRTHTKSIKNSMDFEFACKYADLENRMMYQDEAEEIERIQKKILSISRKLDPYEVFICYKETEDNGERTEDSVIAQDIYNELERQGIRSFFARISLKDKLGQDYEPNIFAALQSAKVMLMVTTSNEHCNAVWVKNEWSRYIAFMKEDGEKTLIPVCKDINPYELPPELSKFQAQDMNKVGSMQDLIYAVKQLVSIKAKEKKDVVLEELVKEKIEREEKKRERQVKVEQSKIAAKKGVVCLAAIGVCVVLVFGGIKLYKNVIYPNNQFKQAEKCMEEKNYDEALEIFYSLQGKKETGQLIRECKYQQAILLYENGDVDAAYSAFVKDKDYPGADEYMAKCAKEIQLSALRKDSDSNFQPEFELNYKKMLPEDVYEVAKVYYDNKSYLKASNLFAVITDYSDAEELYQDSLYQIGVGHYHNKKYMEALTMMVTVSEMGYKKGTAQLKAYQQEIYAIAMSEYNATNWATAKKWFGMLAKPVYQDSMEMFSKCIENIENERALYNGTWIESDRFWTNLKVDNSGVYEANQDDTKRDKWDSMTSEYDEDTGILYFTHWTGERYQMSVQGDRLKITWMNPEDEYDVHGWFSGHNVFYRQ